MVHAIDSDKDGLVSLDDMNQFIQNIGMAGRVSQKELGEAFYYMKQGTHSIAGRRKTSQQLDASEPVLPVEKIIGLMQ